MTKNLTLSPKCASELNAIFDNTDSIKLNELYLEFKKKYGAIPQGDNEFLLADNSAIVLDENTGLWEPKIFENHGTHVVLINPNVK